MGQVITILIMGLITLALFYVAAQVAILIIPYLMGGFVLWIIGGSIYRAFLPKDKK